MKLIDRSKFLKDKDYPTGGERYYNEKRGEHPERIYSCDSNRYKMTVLESIWLYPEYTLVFGKYRKPNIWWFLLNLWCPWYDCLYDLFVDEGLDMSVSQFIIALILCIVTLCGFGPLMCIIIHYRWIKKTHKDCSRMKGFIVKDCYEKYKKIKFF